MNIASFTFVERGNVYSPLSRMYLSFTFCSKESVFPHLLSQLNTQLSRVYMDQTHTSPNSVVIFQSWFVIPSCRASMQTFVRISTLASSKQSNGMSLGCYIGVDNGICLAQAFRTLYNHDCWVTIKLVLAHQTSLAIPTKDFISHFSKHY